MRKTFSLLLLSCLSILASGQGVWTWISGDSAVGNIYGVYGTQGVPSVNNHPPGMYEPCEWKDKQGNFWLYGGVNTLDTGNCDLWKFNPSTREWTWVKGNGQGNQPAIYGTKGTAAPANTPGARGWGAITWVDNNGNLWLFGGADIIGDHNDLWKYNISTNEWTWVSGDNTRDASGVYGTRGIANPLNNPGARSRTCSAWTDAANNLWLFGGNGYDVNGTQGPLNDLWKYNITLNEWTWMHGSSQVSAQSIYGVKGVSNASNVPGARWTYTRWKDLDGNFWLMGGNGYDSATSTINRLSDIWKYNPQVNEWTWMAGPDTAQDMGDYHLGCAFDALNRPSSRYEQRASVNDNCNRFWMFGGYGPGTVLNDLWAFDPDQLKWNWLSGTNSTNQPGNHGTIGVPSPANIPASRVGSVAWWGTDNKYYLFGGLKPGAGYFADVWVYNPDTNCIASCNIYNGFQASATSICENDCINFTSLTTNATSWHWSFQGGSPPTSTDENPFTCYLTSGIYNVTLIASNSAGSDTVTISNYISVAVAPPPPTIQEHPGIGNDTLKFNSNPAYISYQWYKDTTAITGATDTVLIVYESGNYNLKVTGANGCKSAVGINVIVGLKNYMKDNSIRLSPNPANQKLTISDLRFTIEEIDIFNTLGMLIHKSEFVNRKSEIDIDVSALPAGVYFIQLTGDKERGTVRFIKE